MSGALPCRRIRARGRALARRVAVSLASLCALGAVAQGATLAQGQAPVLTAPTPGSKADRRLDSEASLTARAPKSVMLAVASAGRRIVAAGERGLIVYSDDCAVTWSQAKVPVSVTLTALQFVDERTGWAVGHAGVVLKTEDAGATWRKQLDGRAIAQQALSAAREKFAANAGTETQRAVREGERLMAEGPDKPLFAVHFWNSQRGIVVGAYGLALSTEDGGSHWQWIADRIPNPKSLHLYGIWAQDNRVYLAGEQGLVARSGDEGRHFQPVASPYPGSFFGLAGSAHGGGTAPIVYGLRGHVFQLSAQDDSMQPVDTGVQASMLTALPRSGGNVLLFDANGQIVELQGASKRAKPIGTSAVGPVLGATAAETACGSDMVVVAAGLRGLTRIDLDSIATATAKGPAK